MICYVLAMEKQHLGPHVVVGYGIKSFGRAFSLRHQITWLKFAHRWHNKALPNIFDNYFQYANDIHSYNTRYATNKNFYKPCTRTNIGKQSVSSIVVDLWQDLSTSLKNLNTFTFPGKVKQSLLKTQFSNLPI